MKSLYTHLNIFSMWFVCAVVVQLAAAKQSLTLLTNDKDFYSKQLCQLETKLRYADDHIIQLNDQLEKTKQAREELFTEYVASRWLAVFRSGQLSLLPSAGWEMSSSLRATR